MAKLMGIDVGSTTVKVTVIDPATNEILYKSYERHFSRVKECVLNELKKVDGLFEGERISSQPSRRAVGLAGK